LAHADRFDAELLPGRLVPDSEDEWENLFSDHSHLFVTHAATRSLIGSLRTRIRENNEHYAADTVEEWDTIVASSWRERSSELSALVVATGEAREADKRRLDTVLHRLSETGAALEKAEQESKETWEVKRQLERSTPTEVTNRDGTAAVVSLIVLIAVALPVLLSEYTVPVFGMTLDRQSPLIRLLVVFTWVFFLLMSGFAIRSMYLRKHRAQQRRNLVRLKVLREESAENAHVVRDLKATLSEQQLNARRLRDEIAAADVELARLESIMREPFIDAPSPADTTSIVVSTVVSTEESA
ncbi:MAG: hypothetical protein ACKOAG_00200, partial [Candidatus Kapaibacterium sp.]